MRTIPDDVLDKMLLMRPALHQEIATLRSSPDRAPELERALAYAFLGGEVGEPMTAQEVYYLAASSAGHPYGQYIDLDYAAALSTYDTSHLRRMLGFGTIPGIKWRNEWFVDREVVAGLRRSNAGRPRTKQEAP
jgi:hypothetical protein